MGRYDAATTAWVACIRLAPLGCDWALARLGYIYGLTAERALAMRVVDTLKAQLGDAKVHPVTMGGTAVDLATVYVGLGNKAEALKWLERAVEAHSRMLYIAIDPVYRLLYSEPRFQVLLKKIGLPS